MTQLPGRRLPAADGARGEEFRLLPERQRGGVECFSEAQLTGEETLHPFRRRFPDIWWMREIPTLPTGSRLAALN